MLVFVVVIVVCLTLGSLGVYSGSQGRRTPTPAPTATNTPPLPTPSLPVAESDTPEVLPSPSVSTPEPPQNIIVVDKVKDGGFENGPQSKSWLTSSRSGKQIIDNSYFRGGRLARHGGVSSLVGRQEVIMTNYGRSWTWAPTSSLRHLPSGLAPQRTILDFPRTSSGLTSSIQPAIWQAKNL